MKRVLLIAIVFGSVSAAIAQTAGTRASGPGECKLKLSQAPTIRGVHLGMTIDQAMRVFSEPDKLDDLRQSVGKPRFGYQSGGLNPSTTAAREKFVGVSYVHLGFLDGDLNFFSLEYSGPHWTDVDQFVAKVAESLNLPGVESWREALGGKSLTCDKFEVSVSLRAGERGHSIRVSSLAVDLDKIVREREEAQRQTARRAFKP